MVWIAKTATTRWPRPDHQRVTPLPPSLPSHNTGKHRRKVAGRQRGPCCLVCFHLVSTRAVSGIEFTLPLDFHSSNGM